MAGLLGRLASSSEMISSYGAVSYKIISRFLWDGLL